jgi:D-3-phosphoglycerate dehydrogenase / 2-oxoglutarate reductase
MAEVLIPEVLVSSAIDDLRARFDVAYLPDLWKDPEALAAEVRDTRALLVRTYTRVTPAILHAGARLKLVARAGVGLDNIDVEAAEQAGIVVAYTPSQNAISVAEMAIGLIIALTRHICIADRDTHNHGWNRGRYFGPELFSKKLGIIGAGRTGFLTGKRAQAFGMEILANDPYLTQDNIYLSELRAKLVSLDDLLAESDIVSCHVPLTQETTGLMNRHRFEQMKSTAYLINTSRGPVIDEADLVEALKAGEIAGAALDVRRTEPPAPSELEGMPNVILVPHIASFTYEAQERVTRAICDDVVRFLEGKPVQQPATSFSFAR